MSKNTEIRIGQMSDLHLGYRQYGKFKRSIDFFDAAMNAAEIIIEQAPNLVLVPGDIFHRPRPYPADQRHAFRIFGLFKEAGIPVFSIRGNHDASYAWSERQGGNEIDVLEDLGLLTYLKDEYSEIELDNGERIRIWGLGYFGNETGAKLSKLVEENKEALDKSEIPNVLILHAFLDNWIESAELSEYALHQYGFDYIGIGHYHGWWMNGTKDICSSGSTEHVSAAEWNEPERSIALITLSKKGNKWKPDIERLQYAVRPKVRKRIDFGSITTVDAVKKMTELIVSMDRKDAIIRLDVSGILTDTQQVLDIGSAIKAAKQAFHVSIYPEFDYAGLPIRDDISNDEVMKEVFTEKFDISEKQAGKWVHLAEEMKSILTDTLDDKGEDTLIRLLYNFAEVQSTNKGGGK